VRGGYCGTGETLDQAMATFALAYQRQTTADYEALLKAKKSGRIPVPKRT
jgi:hypothetical protein